MGIVSRYDALTLARERKLDLVQVSESKKGEPPVCQIIDYGKFCYNQKKRAKKNKQKQIDWKEVRMTPGTGEHDIQTKIRQIRQFLEQGKYVKLAIKYRRRQIVHVDEGHKIMESVLAAIEDVGKSQNRPRMENRQLTIHIVPK